jgi:hypothetical protein
MKLNEIKNTRKKVNIGLCKLPFPIATQLLEEEWESPTWVMFGRCLLLCNGLWFHFHGNQQSVAMLCNKRVNPFPWQSTNATVERNCDSLLGLRCLPTASTQRRFQLRKAKWELAVLLQLGQCGLALFLLWHPDDLRLWRHDDFQTKLGSSSSVFHKRSAPPFSQNLKFYW